MTVDEYLNDRLVSEIKWYSSKASVNKKLYQFGKAAEIIIAVIIPFLTGHLESHASIKYVIGIFGLLVAIIAGILTLFKFQEKWIEYRATGESLKHEKYMYMTGAGPYKNDASLSNLVERVEYLISKENSNWNQLMNKKEETGAKAS